MTRTFSLVAFAALFVVGLTGCTSPLGALIRGQNPDVHQAGYNRSAGDVRQNVVYAGYGGYDQGQCQCDQCRAQRGCHLHGLFGGKGRTRDHLHYEFTPPQGIVYPQRNQPAGVINYPYYTVKGPTDFFYTGR